MIRLLAQFFTIFIFYQIGNLLVSWFSLPLPGSIVGMGLLFLALSLGGCKLIWVESVAQLHIKHITLLFIPFIVGVWHYTGIFRMEGVKLGAVLAASSLTVLLVTAFIAEFYETKFQRRSRNGNPDL
ncbi:CidA/LrgA family protein [Bacillota bacterium Lsc_1132]